MICSSQMIMVVNVVCHSFLCGQSYVISIQAKINLSLQLVCNHGNYSTCFCSVSDNLAEINCASCTVKCSLMQSCPCGEHLVADLNFLSVTPFSSGMWDDQCDHRVYEVTEVQWPPLNPLIPNVNFCWHHTVQSVSASVERVREEKVGGVSHRVTWTWWLLWLAVETPWLALDGPIIAQMGLENATLTL